MKCQNCGEADATVHFKELKNEEMRELHLCPACAEEKGFHLLVEQQKATLSSKLIWMAENLYPEGSAAVGQVQCSSCGLLYSEFSRQGRLGCSDCYESFDAPLRRLLRRVHGSTKHAGKSPGQPPPEGSAKQRLNRLQDDLQRAIASEDYEGAARIRDQMRLLEKEGAKKEPKS